MPHVKACVQSLHMAHKVHIWCLWQCSGELCICWCAFMPSTPLPPALTGTHTLLRQSCNARPGDAATVALLPWCCAHSRAVVAAILPQVRRLRKNISGLFPCTFGLVTLPM